MAFSFLKRLFGTEDQAGGALPPIVEGAPPEAPADGASAPEQPANFEGLQNFVRYMACSLVDNPEQVTLTTATKNDLTIIQIHCVKKDIGKIIGKSGRIAKAIRTVVKAAAIKQNLRVSVEIVED